METKTSKTANDALKENAEQFNNLFNSTYSTVNEIYKRQLNLAFGFYNNYFNSMLNVGRNNFISPNLGFTNPFSGDGKLQFPFNPLSWMKNDSDLNLFSKNENFIDQINQFNQKWLNTFRNYFEHRQNDRMALNEKYRQLVQERFEIAKNMIDNFNDTYAGQMNFSIESGRKTLDELGKQMDHALKANAEFWNNFLKTYEFTGKEEEENSKTTRKEMVKVA